MNINQLINPTFMCFIVAIIGILIGKIRVFNISLDLSGVLIFSLVCGAVLSLVSPDLYTVEFLNGLGTLSKFGSALFVAAIGLATSVSMSEKFNKYYILYFILGVIMVSSSFLVVKIIQAIDMSIDRSIIFGVLCGAITSTPGLSTVCEANNIISQNALLGYGCAYVFGVVGVVLFVQILTRNIKSSVVKSHKTKVISKKDESIIPIGVSVVVGYIIGNMKILDFSLGVSGGILCSALLVGSILQRLKRIKLDYAENLSIYRNLGLILFFVGTGIPAGNSMFLCLDIKLFVYGVFLTIIPLIIGYLLTKLVFKQSNELSALGISGGMTSTPAMGILLKNSNLSVDTCIYSFAYVGALFTATIGIKFIL